MSANALGRLAATPRARTAAAYVALGVLFLWPLALHPTWMGSGDWAFFHFFEEAFLRAAREHHEVMLWNPWYCGGSFGLANPQSQVLSPFFWVSLALGGTAGLKARIVGYFAAGAAGAHLLAADTGVPRGLGRFFAGATFASAGFFAWHVGGGHAAFLPFYLLPWTWLCYRRAAAGRGSAGARAAWAAALAALWALMLFDGGVYPLPFSVLLVGFHAAWDLVRGPDARTRAAAVLVPLGAGACAVLLGAPKLWPVLDVLRELPRAVGSKDTLGLVDPVVMFLAHRWARAYPPHVYVWPEFASYLGPLAVALAAGAALAKPRARAREIVLLACAGALLAGNHGPFSPYELLRRLPLFGSLRVPSRWAVIITLVLAVLGAHGVAALQRLLGHARASATAPAATPLAAPALPPSLALRAARAIVTLGLFVWVAAAAPWLAARAALCAGGALTAVAAGGFWPRRLAPGPAARATFARAALGFAVLGLVEATAVNGVQLFPSFDRPPAPTWRDGPFLQKAGRVGLMHRYVWKNYGSVRCYDELRVPTGAIRTDAPSEVWLERAPGLAAPAPAAAPPPSPTPAFSPAPGSAPVSVPVIAAWSPNGVEVDVTLATPARLVWNMNFHRHWRAVLLDAPDTPVAPVAHRGLVAVDLPAGTHRLALRYAIPVLAPAVAASLATSAALAAGFGLAAFRRRRRRALPPAQPAPPPASP
ncbi:MAG TPA: hypothetical protein VG389_15925 [Myxococcota bacterium]|nr:hypothetical protein [Myxococcota bacterium]